MALPLNSVASVDEVTNIVIFVSDSVRYRNTSEDILSLGASTQAIAASTWTASSFPSIVTGKYPATHCIWSFDDRFSDRPMLLRGPETFGMNSETIWTDLPPEDKPLFKMLNATSEDAADISTISSPFVYIEHHKGGHMPYGHDFSEYTSPEFWEKEKPTIEELESLYNKSVQSAEKRFFNLINELEQRELLDETLIIYTSDHGETLGELRNNGNIGHGSPITPDTVRVPVVFIGPGIPDDDINTLLSGVDITPTVLSALGHTEYNVLDGIDCWRERPEDRLLRSEYWTKANIPILNEINRYKATSVWDKDGGFVFTRGNDFSRLAIGSVVEFVNSSYAYLLRPNRHPKRFLNVLKSHGCSSLKYGQPEFDKKDVVEELKEFSENRNKNEPTVDPEHLKDLGYLN